MLSSFPRTRPGLGKNNFRAQQVAISPCLTTGKHSRGGTKDIRSLSPTSLRSGSLFSRRLSLPLKEGRMCNRELAV